MIDRKELRRIAQGRLNDAETLFRSTRFDGAVYLCGYAVEIGLKARICVTLKWAGYPSTTKEFGSYQSFRTHDLDTLLHLSGMEAKVKKHYFAEWSVIATWDPNSRYLPIGSATRTDATAMLASVNTLLGVI